jgi:uncharacterized protein YydD (DUF2326 family)
MIISIGSSIDSFRPLTFRPGFNVLLADQSEVSTDRQTRNSAGKSSVIEIVHFLLGADLTKGTPFTSKELKRASFFGSFRISGTVAHVTRNVHQRDRVFVKFDEPPNNPLHTEGDLIEPFTPIKDWNLWLGHEFFNLPIHREGSVFENGGPSFRTLFPYFARRRSNGGFMSPSKTSDKVQDYTANTALSYLLGLDWTIVRDFETAKQEQKEVSEDAKSSVRDNPSLKSIASVRAAHVLAESRANELKEQIASFRVEDHYHDLVKEASDAQIEAERLSRESVQYATRIRHIEASIENETPSTLNDVKKLYEAVGFQLPDSVRIGFEKVEAFHESVISNRKAHLSQDLENNRKKLAQLEAERKKHTIRRNEILESLKGKGAFSELIDIQQRLADANQQIAKLAAQRDAMMRAESSKDELKKERINLKQRLEADHQNRKQAITDAVLAVDEALNELYEDKREKYLRIVASESGPKFNVHIAGNRSGGIANMEIFALDYALLKIVTKSMGGPGFLIHDSHLFDGVDERQVVAALEVGAALADQLNVQYIVTMNSDVFNTLPFTDGFDAANACLPVVLDDTETGGLFGFRFD